MFRHRPGLAGLAAIALASASCLTVTGCGGLSAASLSASPVASTADPLAALTGNQVATQALANLKAASSVILAGTVTDSGTSYTLNVGIKPGHGCAGTIATASQGSFKLILIGKVVYLNPDTKFWKANAGASAPAIIALIKGRYIKTTTSKNGMSAIASLCDVSHVIGSLTVSGIAPKRAVTTLHGVRVLPLEDSGNGVLYVTDTSKPEVVEMRAAGASAGTVTFSVGTPVTLTPPPASQVIDGSQVGL